MTGLELVAVVLAAVRLMTWRRAAGEVVGSDPARVPHRDLPSGSGRPGFIVPPRAVLDCDRVVSWRVFPAAQGRSVAVEFNGSYRHRPPQPHGSRSLRAVPLTIIGS
ncbi:hypothetical protein ACWD8L_40005 [Streptomyces sp. NPDC005133]|uniref:hypothetical protein n=1 Tax=unclassified Streptomyces TaxID=2593676 RepID=UPI0033AE3822